MKNKIEAKLVGESIVIKAQFFRYQDETPETPAGEILVHEINTAFPIGTTEKKIRKEIQKAGDLFELEEKQRSRQKEVDKKFEEVNKIINNLNS